MIPNVNIFKNHVNGFFWFIPITCPSTLFQYYAVLGYRLYELPTLHVRKDCHTDGGKWKENTVDNIVIRLHGDMITRSSRVITL